MPESKGYSPLEAVLTAAERLIDQGRANKEDMTIYKNGDGRCALVVTGKVNMVIHATPTPEGSDIKISRSGPGDKP